MKAKSLIIVTALLVGLCWINPGVAAIREDAQVPAEPGIIGRVILPCGCPGFVWFIKLGEYGLTIPTHNEVYNFAVIREDGKLMVTMIILDGSFRDVYTSIPPYEKWWSETLEDWLTEGMLGFMVLDIIRDHYQKSVIRT